MDLPHRRHAPQEVNQLLDIRPHLVGLGRLLSVRRRSHNDAFVKSNCPPETYTNNNLNLIWITDATGKLVWGETHDDRDGKPIDLGFFAPRLLAADRPLVKFSPAPWTK